MNSFFGLGPMELALIVFIALIVLGPQRLPGTIREVMKYWKYFRNLSGELTAQFSEELKGLEDLDPQRILKDLADELDDEVEQTKKAAGITKPAPKKATTAKPSAAKPSPTKPSTLVEKAASPEVVETSAVGTAAAVATAKTDDAKAESADDVNSLTEDGTHDLAAQIEETAPSEPDAQIPASNGETPTSSVASETPAEPLVAQENTILPPASADDSVVPDLEEAVPVPESTVAESTVVDSVDGDGQQIETVGAEQGAVVDLPVNFDDGEAGESSEPETAPAVSKAIASAEPTPVAVNGKGVRPEDEG